MHYTANTVLAFLDVNSISFLQLLWGIFYFQDIFLRFFWLPSTHIYLKSSYLGYACLMSYIPLTGKMYITLLQSALDFLFEELIIIIQFFSTVERDLSSVLHSWICFAGFSVVLCVNWTVAVKRIEKGNDC